MRNLILAFACLFITNIATAQFSPVKWSFSAEKVSEKEYDIVITADIAHGWSVYSQYLESDDGPVKTAFEFEKNENLQLIGKTEELGHKKESFDELFGMNLIKFSKKVKFTQRVKVADKKQPVSGVLTYMTCDETSCLPPTDVDFTVALP